MNYNSTFKNLILFLVSVLVMGLMIYYFVVGDRKLGLIILSILAAVAFIYNIIKNITIVRTTDNPEHKHSAILAIKNVIFGAIIFVVAAIILYKYFIVG